MPAARRRAAAQAKNTRARPLIFYAEHDHVIRLTVRDALKRAGFDVEDCRDGVYARAMLETASGRGKTYDLLLSQELPGIDGLSLVRHARGRRHTERTPIILLSFEDGADEARAAGADEFLQKPNDLPGLVETVRRLLRGRRQDKKGGKLKRQK
jgi:DNA-binding response OmpR family regulator